MHPQYRSRARRRFVGFATLPVRRRLDPLAHRAERREPRRPHGRPRVTTPARHLTIGERCGTRVGEPDVRIPAAHWRQACRRPSTVAPSGRLRPVGSTTRKSVPPSPCRLGRKIGICLALSRPGTRICPRRRPTRMPRLERKQADHPRNGLDHGSPREPEHTRGETGPSRCSALSRSSLKSTGPRQPIRKIESEYSDPNSIFRFQGSRPLAQGTNDLAEPKSLPAVRCTHRSLHP